MRNYRRLLDICDFQGGTQPPKDEWVNTPQPGYIRMLQIRDYSQGDPKFIEYVKDTGKLHKCTKEDIMLSRYGYIGQAFTGLEGAYNVALVKVVKLEPVLNSYLYYYFQSPYFQHTLLSNVGSRATIPGFNKTELEKALIPVPTDEEQQSIVERLQKVDNLIEKHKQQIFNLDELVKSRFVEMFGDSEYNTYNLPVVYLSDLCNIGSSKRIYQSEQSETGVPFLRISDLGVLMDTGEIKADLYIPYNRFEELKSQGLVPDTGDILVTSRGTIGRCYIVKDSDNFYFQDGMISWLSRFSDDVMSLYIAYLFDMTGFKKQINNLQAGSTVAYLSIAMLKKLKIMLPPIELQNQFAEFVQGVNKERAAIQESLEELEVLKKPLMQKYFG